MTVSVHVRLTCLLLSSVLLTGCVNLKLSPSNAQFASQSPKARYVQLGKIQTWDIAGAFSFKSQGKVNLANYTWQQTAPSTYVINIDSALHLYRVTVEGTPHQVKLIESQQRVMTAATPEALLKKRLQTQLPIQALQFWIRGIPAPGHYQAQYDSFGHLDRLEQAGWQLNYDHYTSVKGIDLPQRISITGPQQQMRLVIKTWSL